MENSSRKLLSDDFDEFTINYLAACDALIERSLPTDGVWGQEYYDPEYYPGDEDTWSLVCNMKRGILEHGSLEAYKEHLAKPHDGDDDDYGCICQADHEYSVETNHVLAKLYHMAQYPRERETRGIPRSMIKAVDALLEQAEVAAANKWRNLVRLVCAPRVRA